MQQEWVVRARDDLPGCNSWNRRPSRVQQGGTNGDASGDLGDADGIVWGDTVGTLRILVLSSQACRGGHRRVCGWEMLTGLCREMLSGTSCVDAVGKAVGDVVGIS